jgi:hypothetical protein
MADIESPFIGSILIGGGDSMATRGQAILTYAQHMRRARAVLQHACSGEVARDNFRLMQDIIRYKSKPINFKGVNAAEIDRALAIVLSETNSMNELVFKNPMFRDPAFITTADGGGLTHE